MAAELVSLQVLEKPAEEMAEEIIPLPELQRLQIVVQAAAVAALMQVLGQVVLE